MNKLMEEKISRQFYIVGYMHSGASLLHVVLKQNPELFSTQTELKFYEFYDSIVSRFPDISTPELKEKYIRYLFLGIGVGFLNTIAKDERKVKNLVSFTEEDIHAILDECQHINSYGEIFVKVYDFISKDKIWFTKVASYSIEQVIKDTPNVKFINIVRDVRDVLASKKKRKETATSNEKFIKKNEVKKKKLEKVFDAYWDSMGWKESVDSSIRKSKKFPDRILFIRYEDLVMSPEETIRKCCAFLGIDFAANMVNISYGNSADKKYKNVGGIVASSKGRYKENLSQSEIAIIQRNCKKEMLAFGYEPDLISFSNTSLSYLQNMAVPFNLLKRIVMKYRLTSGGALFRQRMKNYVKKFLKLN